MDPNQQPQPYQNQPPQPVAPTNSMPYGAQQPQPQPVTVASTPTTMPAPKNKLFLPLCIVAAAELLVIIGLLIALSSTHKAVATPVKTVDKSLSQDPQPATTTGLQQTNDAISQDITNLDIDASFPAKALDDTSLSL
jgi:hypothetical protein